MFSPAVAPGAIAAAGFNAFDRSQSMMQRATAARQQEEMNRMQMQKVRAEMPAIIAKARADEVSSQAALRARDQMENLRRNGAAASVQANEEYIGALAIPDWDEQSRVLSKLQAKYGWMANVRDESGQPIYKGFLDTLDNSVANAYMRGQIDKTISGQIQIQGDKSETALEVAKARAATQKEIADERTRTQTAIAAERAQTQKEIAELKAANKVGPAQQKFEEELGTTAAKYYNTVQEKTAEHQRTLDNVADARALIEKGAEQGLGEESKVALAKGLNAFTRAIGAGDVLDTSKPEQLQRIYSDFALAAAARMKNQGQITESERKLLADTVARFGNSKKAALYIMGHMEAVANREIAKAQWLRERRMENQMVGPEDEPEFYVEHPLSYFLPAMGEAEQGGQSDVERVLAKYRKPNAQP